jgi:uncharacterized membrane protein YdbT with pleckstrin-like domain
MPARLRLIKSDEPRAEFRADASPRLWAAAACAAAAVTLTSVGYEGRLAPVVAGPSAAGLLLWAAYLSLTFAQRSAERIVLTASRLEIARGVLRRRTETVELWRVREVILSQILFERARGVGRITLLFGAAPARQPLVVGPVVRARALHEALLAATAKAAAKSAATS